MAPLRGGGSKSERLRGFAPHGHWRTRTFALRSEQLTAPCVFDGPINGEASAPMSNVLSTECSSYFANVGCASIKGCSAPGLAQKCRKPPSGTRSVPGARTAFADML